MTLAGSSETAPLLASGTSLPEVHSVTHTGTSSSQQSKSALWSFLGIILAILASMLIATSAGCAQALNGAVPNLELTLGSKLFLLVFTLPKYIISANCPKVPPAAVPWTLLFCILCVTCSVCLFASVHFLPLGTVGCVQRALQFLSVVILSRLLLKEKIGVLKLLAVIFCVIGATLVSQPHFLFGQHNNSTPLRQFQTVIDNTVMSNRSLSNNRLANNITIDNVNFQDAKTGRRYDALGYLFVSGTALSITTCVIIQKLKLQEVSSMDLNFWTAVIGAPLSLSATFVMENPTLPTNKTDWILAVAVCLCFALVSVVAVQAVHMTSPVLACIAFSSQVVFMLVGQYAFLSHLHHGESPTLEITGSVLIICSVVIGATQQ